MIYKKKKNGLYQKQNLLFKKTALSEGKDKS